MELVLKAQPPQLRLSRHDLFILPSTFSNAVYHFNGMPMHQVIIQLKRLSIYLCLASAILFPSLPDMVSQRLMVGFRFKNVEFEHLLGLIHAAICISILDSEISHVAERQEAIVKLKKVEIFKHLFGQIRKVVITLLAKMENMKKGRKKKSISYATELEESKLPYIRKRIQDWNSIPYGMQLQEAGVEF